MDALEITDAVTTKTGSIKVTVKATGKTAYLPADTTIRPGFAIIPAHIKRKILGAPAPKKKCEKKGLMKPQPPAGPKLQGRAAPTTCEGV
jgi:hypothetical protein